jgi:hypothetical protein
MQFTAAALATILLMSNAALAQVPSSPAPGTEAQAPGTQTPAPGTPAAPGAPVPVVPAPVVPPVPQGARTFTAKTGLIFNAVRPDRVVDFEMVIGYLQQAFAKSTDATVRAQAQGWRVFKAAELGPNGSALYVFVIDPAVPGSEYGLGRILSDAYPDQIQEIWKLYMNSLASGGSLLNLMPVQPPSLLTPPSSAPAAPPAP